MIQIKTATHYKVQKKKTKELLKDSITLLTKENLTFLKETTTHLETAALTMCKKSHLKTGIHHHRVNSLTILGHQKIFQSWMAHKLMWKMIVEATMMKDSILLLKIKVKMDKKVRVEVCQRLRKRRSKAIEFK